jgi:hypothetical protein
MRVGGIEWDLCYTCEGMDVQDRADDWRMA